MTSFRFYLILASISLISLHCSKGGSSTPPDSNPSDIVIASPNPVIIYINGSNLDINGTITDNDNLASARMELRNKTTGVIYNQQTSNTGTVTFYRYQWYWIVAGITAPLQATLKITARDKQGYEISKETDLNLSN